MCHSLTLRNAEILTYPINPKGVVPRRGLGGGIMINYHALAYSTLLNANRSPRNVICFRPCCKSTTAEAVTAGGGKCLFFMVWTNLLIFLGTIFIVNRGSRIAPQAKILVF